MDQADKLDTLSRAQGGQQAKISRNLGDACSGALFKQSLTKSSPKRAHVCWMTLKSHLSFKTPDAGKGDASSETEIGSGGGVPVMGCGLGLPLRNDIRPVDEDETLLMVPPPMGLNPVATAVAAGNAAAAGFMMDLAGAAWWNLGVDDGGIEALPRALQPFHALWIAVAASVLRSSRILSSCCLAPSLRKTCFLPWAHDVFRGIGTRAAASSPLGSVDGSLSLRL